MISYVKVFGISFKTTTDILKTELGIIWNFLFLIPIDEENLLYGFSVATINKI